MSINIPEIEDAEVISTSATTGRRLIPRRPPHRTGQEKGLQDICVRPRKTETARIADIYLPIKGGTNMLFLNAMAHVIVTSDW